MAPPQLWPLLALSVGILGISGVLGIPAPGRSPEEPHAPRRPRSEPSPSSLLWVPFRGLVPPDAVSVPSARPGLRDFVCSTRALGCNLGSFTPELGGFCTFTWGGEELRSSQFQLLLNPGGFEALDWVNTSFGAAPPGAVEGCPLTDLFVGRSPQGLGKASKEQEALFVPVDGEEVWYKWYQVLAVRQGALDVAVTGLVYNESAAQESAESAELAAVPVRNERCEGVTKSLTLEEATEVEQGWSAELPALAGTRGVLRAAPVVLTEPAGWEPGNETAVPWAGGASLAEFVSRLHEVTGAVPARSECDAVLRGRRREIRVPFRAELTREFRSGPPHRVGIAGWGWSRAVTGVRAGMERCRPLGELPPCPP